MSKKVKTVESQQPTIIRACARIANGFATLIENKDFLTDDFFTGLYMIPGLKKQLEGIVNWLCVQLQNWPEGGSDDVETTEIVVDVVAAGSSCNE